MERRSYLIYREPKTETQVFAVASRIPTNEERAAWLRALVANLPGKRLRPGKVYTIQTVA